MNSKNFMRVDYSYESPKIEEVALYLEGTVLNTSSAGIDYLEEEVYEW